MSINKYKKQISIVAICSAVCLSGLALYTIFDGGKDDSETQTAKAGEFGVEQIGYGGCTYGGCDLDSIVYGDFTFSHPKGLTAPLFKSLDDVTVTYDNMEVSFDPLVENGEYQCKFAAYIMGETIPHWLGGSDITPIDYDVTNGCSVVFPKSVRNIVLNWDVQVEIVKASDNSDIVGIDREGYFFRFEGAGAGYGE